MRDLEFLKPKKFQDYLTISELSRFLKRDVSRIRQLEKEDRIPKAIRVKRGQNQVRLWSPAQAEECKRIVNSLRPGRPSSNG